jgi:type II secretory pathway pseudopilin PulG
MLHRSNPISVRGFTLIETVIVISLTVIVGAALMGAVEFFYRTNDYVIQENAAVQNARLGISAAMQTLREASYGDDGSYPIANAATSTITFYANIQGGTSVQRIRYYLQGLTLYRGVTTAVGNPPSYSGQPEVITTVATNVRNTAAIPLYQYYDSSGTLLAAPVTLSSIASVVTTLKIDVDPNRSPAPYTLIGSAMLRNL